MGPPDELLRLSYLDCQDTMQLDKLCFLESRLIIKPWNIDYICVIEYSH